MKKIINKKWLRSQYNRLVKPEFKVGKLRENYLQYEAMANAEKDGCDAYIEIPSYMTKSGHAEIIK